ncbi:MAG: T9SS type A sorting domain-containing protein [bacterium]|nr:T9SS type A sorting domain-containing protein [bacterium]
MVFPNPGRDKFTFANVSPGDLIEITDLSGKLVHQQIAKDKMAAVELPYVAKGAYLYRITRNSKEVLRGKLVLQQ